MPTATRRPLLLSEEQALHFRARRGHLAGPGAEDPLAAARDILGAQAQQLAPALLALSQRTRGHPDAHSLATLLLDEPRRLVRTWGQRETLHLYDPADWADVVAAREHWAPGGRRGTNPDERAVSRARQVLLASARPVSRQDLLGVAPPEYAASIEHLAGSAEAAIRFAAGRLIWILGIRGELCHAGKEGAQQTYAPRRRWFPALAWPDPPGSGRQAAARLTRRYLALHGPATHTDVAHFFGARVKQARGWLDLLRKQDELTAVDCGGRAGLVALTADADDLRAAPPPGATGWPLRLLPTWDCLLMGHADKSWTVPCEGERKEVWRRGAFVAAVVLARGRVVATWTQRVRRGRLELTVAPLDGWRRSRHAAGVRREARSVAAHLGLAGAEVQGG